jgi:hypothetical protein
LLLIEHFVDKHNSAVPQPVHGCPPTEPPSKDRHHFLQQIPNIKKKAKPERSGMHSKHGK